MAITKVINDAVDLNQTSDYSGLRLPVGTTGDVVESFTTEYLVVAGGGGTSGDSPGGGGGGGLRTSYDSSTTTTNSLSFPSGKTAIATYMLDNNATDISGNYNGTETNITYNTGQYGGAAVFNGSSSKIVLPNNANIAPQNNFAISCWINCADVTQDSQMIWSMQAPTAGRAFLQLSSPTQGGDKALRIYTSLGSQNVTNQIESNTWYHLVFVKSSTDGVILYKNGSAIITRSSDTGDIALSTITATDTNRIGSYRTTAESNWFNGTIDQFRIYDTALSSTDVSNIYTNEVQANSGGGVAAETSLTLNAGVAYDVTVGAGGASNTIGSSSIFSTITSTGGGRGGGSGSGGYSGGNGGSGGGGAGGIYSSAGGNGTIAQGYAGGSSGANTGGTSYPGGGGGGAVSVGASPSGSGDPGGNGGAGLAVNILNATNAASASVGEVSSSNVYYSGGGGGSTYQGTPGNGGLGGAGDGDRSDDGTSANNGTINTGGGGGGTNATGGSGVVILRYPTASVSSFTTTGTLNTPSTVSQTQFTEGSDTIIIFTEGTGTVTFSGVNPAPPQGALRTNTSYSEDGSASVIEHYNGTDWKYFDAIKYCTTNTLNFPSGAGCIASYNLDNNVNDIGNTYNGVNSNVTFNASGKFGAAAVFNGSSSVITLPALPITTSSNVTFSAWIKGSTDATDATIVSTLGENGLEFRVNNSAVRAVYRKGSSWYASSTVSITADAWNHVVLTYEQGVGFNIYVNNNTPTIYAETGTLSILGSSNTIGKYANGSSGYFDGLIDQVRIFNDSLTSDEVSKLYNNEIACS